MKHVHTLQDIRSGIISDRVVLVLITSTCGAIVGLVAARLLLSAWG